MIVVPKITRMHNLLEFVCLITISLVGMIVVQIRDFSTLMQVQTWDINPTTVYSLFVAALMTAIVILWRSNKELSREIKELNKILMKEIKDVRDSKAD